MKRCQVPLKKSRIKKKKPTEEQVQKRSEDIEKMWQLFNEHWILKKQRNMTTGLNYWQCENCYTGIWGENLSLYHDHLLPKSRYPEFKYEIENLFLCCGNCHSKKESGFPGTLHKEAIEAAKKRFSI